MTLCNTPLNGSGVNSTHEREVGRLRIGDKKMAKESHDSQRKDELITGCRILINIYKGEYKVRREVNREILNEG